MPETSNESEVDSVLSAIRRLIQDGRPEGGEGASPAAMDRLMLTPALRVDDRPEPLVLTAAPAPLRLGTDVLLDTSDTLILMNARPAGTAPASLGPSDPVRAELAVDLGALDALMRELATPPAPEAPPAAAPLGPSDPLEAELSVDPGALEAALDPVPDATPQPLDSVNPPSPAQADLPADEGTADMTPPDPHRPGDAPAPLPPLVLVPSHDEQSAAPTAAASAELGAMPADPDHGQAPDGSTPAPVDAVPMPPSGETAAPDADTLDPIPPAPASSPEVPGTPEPALPEPPALPDEAVLRALVAEVLREELRGELGEKLTRNLRKLVRREVMQALALRDR